MAARRLDDGHGAGQCFGSGIRPGEKRLPRPTPIGRGARSAGLLSGMLFSAPIEQHATLTWSW